MERVGHNSRSAVNKGMNGTMASEGKNKNKIEINEVVNEERIRDRTWILDHPNEVDDFDSALGL